MCVRWMGMRRWKLWCGEMSVGNRFSACTHFAECRNYRWGGERSICVCVCVSVCSGQCRSLSSDKQVLCHTNVYFFSKSSYKTAVKSPGDSCVSSAGLFIENMLFYAAVIQSNAVKHCNIHFGEQLLQVKTKEQQWDTCHNVKDSIWRTRTGRNSH